VTKEAKIYHPEKFEYFRLAIADNAQTNILSHIDEVVDRIESARLKNQNVLVHCVAGMSRLTFFFLNIYFLFLFIILLFPSSITFGSNIQY